MGLAFLFGVGAGLYAIVQERRLVGMLTIAGFLLLSIDPIAEIVIFRVVSGNLSGGDPSLLNWPYTCISTPTIFLGAMLLTAVLVLVIRPPAPKTSSSD